MAENEPKEVEKDEQVQDKKADCIAWLRFAVLTISVLIPLVTGLVCLIGGNTHGNRTVAFAGMLILAAGLPAVMIIGVISTLIWKVRSFKKAESDTTSTVHKRRRRTKQVATRRKKKRRRKESTSNKR